jgi:hypothetical protein
VWRIPLEQEGTEETEDHDIAVVLLCSLPFLLLKNLRAMRRN